MEGDQELLINYDAFVNLFKRNKLNICWVEFFMKSNTT